MKQSGGQSEPYVASFAVGTSCLRQSNAFDKSVSSISPTPLLSRLFFYIDVKMNMYSSKHSPSINFGEGRKNINRTKLFDI